MGGISKLKLHASLIQFGGQTNNSWTQWMWIWGSENCEDKHTAPKGGTATQAAIYGRRIPWLKRERGSYCIQAYLSYLSNIKTWFLKVCCQFISNDFEWTILGTSSQFWCQINYKSNLQDAYCFMVFVLDECGVCLCLIISALPWLIVNPCGGNHGEVHEEMRQPPKCWVVTRWREGSVAYGHTSHLRNIKTWLPEGLLPVHLKRLWVDYFWVFYN